MTDQDKPTRQVVTGGDTAAPVPVSKQAVAAYESILSAVPDAGGEGYERILYAISKATDVTDLDAPWRTSDLEGLAGIPISVRGISKMPSTYEGGLPWFLVVDAVNEITGEPIIATTGAVSVVAQLAKAHQLGKFPLRCKVMMSERESSRGFRAQHLEMLDQRPRVAEAAATS